MRNDELRAVFDSSFRIHHSSLPSRPPSRSGFRRKPAPRKQGEPFRPAVEEQVQGQGGRDEAPLLHEELFVDGVLELLHDHFYAGAPERLRVEVRDAGPARVVAGSSHGLADVEDKLRLLPRGAERRGEDELLLDAERAREHPYRPDVQLRELRPRSLVELLEPPRELLEARGARVAGAERLPVLRAPAFARHLDLVNPLPEPLRDRNREPLRAAAPLHAVAVLKVALRELHVVEQDEHVRPQKLLEEAEPGHVLRLVNGYEHGRRLLLHAYVDLLQRLDDRRNVLFRDR